MTTTNTANANTRKLREQIQEQAHAAGYEQTPGFSEDAHRAIDDMHPDAWQWWADSYREGVQDREADRNSAEGYADEADALYGDA